MCDESFVKAAGEQDVVRMLAILQSQASDHAHTPKQAVKETALKIIKKHTRSSQDLYAVGKAFTDSDSVTGHELGAILLADSYGVNPSEVNSTLMKLADSPNWEVREWIASGCSIVLLERFEQFYPVLLQWTTHDSPNVRRAAAVAVKYTAKSKDKAIAEPLIDLIEPLLGDSDPYVKKNLGVFAIGDGLLKYYPDHVKKRMVDWALNDNEQVRWNVLKIFSSAEGAKYIEDFEQTVRFLSMDERPIVRKAYTSFINSLKKRNPELYRKLA